MSRRRRANVIGGRQHRHEVKVSPEEEAVIAMAANEQGVTPVRFLVEAALAVAAAERDGVPETPSARRQQVVRLYELQGVIAEVAFQAKKVGTNVNQVVKAYHQGQPLPVEEIREFLVAEREHLAHARVIYDRITGLIEERAAAGIAV